MKNCKHCIPLALTVITLTLISPVMGLAQLERLNNSKSLKESDKAVVPIVTAPPEMADVKLIRDSATSPVNDSRQELDDLQARADFTKNRIRAMEIRLLEYEAQKSARNEAQDNAIKELKEDTARLHRQLESVAKETVNIKLQLESKELESKQIIEAKRIYRKDLYERILISHRQNRGNIDSSYTRIKRELNLRIDSLKPDRWPLYSTNKDTMVREMATLYGLLWSATREIERNLKKTQEHFSTIDEKIKSYEEINLYLTYGDKPERFMDTIFNARRKELQDAFDEEEAAHKAFQEKYEVFRGNFKVNLAKVNELSARHKPQEIKKETEASILANFLQPLNQSTSLVPGVDILASQTFGSNEVGMMGLIKLFMAAPGSDTNRLDHTTKMFIPEASQFGVMANFTFGLVSTKRRNSEDKLVGIVLSFYYLQKQLIATDATKALFGTGILQLRSGLELTLVKNALLVYGNLNGYLLGKGVEQYQKYYSNDNSFKWFGDVGLRSYLKLQSDAKINLLLDLRFIPVGNTVRNVTGSKDKFIPLFKLGIVKDFDF